MQKFLQINPFIRLKRKRLWSKRTQGMTERGQLLDRTEEASACGTEEFGGERKECNDKLEKEAIRSPRNPISVFR